MKRRSLLLFSLGFVLLLGALYGAVVLWPSAEPPAATAEKEILLSVDPATATTITFTTAKEELCLEKRGDFWYLQGEDAFPLDQDIPKNMLAIVSPLAPRRHVSDAPESDALYGFDSPVRVSVTDAHGVKSFLLGDECATVEGYYVKTSTSESVYLAELSVGIAYCHEDRYDLIVMDPYPKIEKEQITEIRVTTPTQTVALVQTDSEASSDSAPLWHWESQQSLTAATKEAADRLLACTVSISFVKCIDYAPTESELSSVFAEGRSITVKYLHKGSDNAQNELLTPGEFTLLVEATPLDGKHYRCKLSSSGQICQVEKEPIEELFHALTP